MSAEPRSHAGFPSAMGGVGANVAVGTGSALSDKTSNVTREASTVSDEDIAAASAVDAVAVAAPAAGDAAALCLDCGLCCNGVLFDMVELQPGDLAKALMARGLKIKKKRWFKQPCAALCEGTLCALYQDRPVRCRAFECRTFKAVAAGEVTPVEARQRIAEARRRVVAVEDVLANFDELQPGNSLAKRVANVLARRPSGGLETAGPAGGETDGTAGGTGKTAGSQGGSERGNAVASMKGLEFAMADLSGFLNVHFRL